MIKTILYLITRSRVNKIFYSVQGPSKSNLEVIDIVNNVEGFYNNSLNKVLWIVGVFFTLSSILAPLILNWMQKRKYKLDKKELKNYIEDRMESLENKIDKKIEEKLMEEKENIEKQNELKLLELEGEFHGSLARNYKFMDDTVIKTAIGETINVGFSEYCLSAIKYVEANNIEKAHYIIKKIINKLKNEARTSGKRDQKSLRKLIKTLHNHNSHHQYSTYLDKLTDYID